MDEDILYHLDLGTKTHNLPAMFGDVKVKVFWMLVKWLFPLQFFKIIFPKTNSTALPRDMSEVPRAHEANLI